jgi:hypothetical protein
LTQAQIEVEFHFENQCQSTVIKDSISFELQNLATMESFYSEDSKVIIPSPGKYELSVTISNGKYERSYEEKMEFTDSQKVFDTLTIPKILFETDNDSKTTYSKYFKCEKVCDGYEVDYFENGKKRLEGNFSKGKAIWETEFERNGSFIKYYYNKSDRYTRVVTYDSNGNLTEYYLNTYKKENWLQKTYDGKGKLIKTEVKTYIR